MDYRDFEELEELLLHKKLKAWSETQLLLEDDTLLKIVCSERDCICVKAGGSFEKVKLDAMITDVKLVDKGFVERDHGEKDYLAEVVLFHNQNPIAIANCHADDGNCGFYYGVCSIVVLGKHYKVVTS